MDGSRLVRMDECTIACSNFSASIRIASFTSGHFLLSGILTLSTVRFSVNRPLYFYADQCL